MNINLLEHSERNFDIIYNTLTRISEQKIMTSDAIETIERCVAEINEEARSTKFVTNMNTNIFLNKLKNGYKAIEKSVDTILEEPLFNKADIYEVVDEFLFRLKIVKQKLEGLYLFIQNETGTRANANIIDSFANETANLMFNQLRKNLFKAQEDSSCNDEITFNINDEGVNNKNKLNVNTRNNQLKRIEPLIDLAIYIIAHSESNDMSSKLLETLTVLHEQHFGNHLAQEKSNEFINLVSSCRNSKFVIATLNTLIFCPTDKIMGLVKFLYTISLSVYLKQTDTNCEYSELKEDKYMNEDFVSILNITVLLCGLSNSTLEDNLYIAFHSLYKNLLKRIRTKEMIVPQTLYTIEIIKKVVSVKIGIISTSPALLTKDQNISNNNDFDFNGLIDNSNINDNNKYLQKTAALNNISSTNSIVNRIKFIEILIMRLINKEKANILTLQLGNTLEEKLFYIIIEILGISSKYQSEILSKKLENLFVEEKLEIGILLTFADFIAYDLNELPFCVAYLLFVLNCYVVSLNEKTRKQDVMYIQQIYLKLDQMLIHNEQKGFSGDKNNQHKSKKSLNDVNNDTDDIIYISICNANWNVIASKLSLYLSDLVKDDCMLVIMKVTLKLILYYQYYPASESNEENLENELLSIFFQLFNYCGENEGKPFFSLTKESFWFFILLLRTQKKQINEDLLSVVEASLNTIDLKESVNLQKEKLIIGYLVNKLKKSPVAISSVNLELISVLVDTATDRDLYILRDFCDKNDYNLIFIGLCYLFNTKCTHYNYIGSEELLNFFKSFLAFSSLHEFILCKFALKILSVLNKMFDYLLLFGMEARELNKNAFSCIDKRLTHSIKEISHIFFNASISLKGMKEPENIGSNHGLLIEDDNINNFMNSIDVNIKDDDLSNKKYLYSLIAMKMSLLSLLQENEDFYDNHSAKIFKNKANFSFNNNTLSRFELSLMELYFELRPLKKIIPSSQHSSKDIIEESSSQEPSNQDIIFFLYLYNLVQRVETGELVIEKMVLDSKTIHNILNWLQMYNLPDAKIIVIFYFKMIYEEKSAVLYLQKLADISSSCICSIISLSRNSMGTASFNQVLRVSLVKLQEATVHEEQRLVMAIYSELIKSSVNKEETIVYIQNACLFIDRMKIADVTTNVLEYFLFQAFLFLKSNWTREHVQTLNFVKQVFSDLKQRRVIKGQNLNLLEFYANTIG